jgi:hypothetical protein
MQQRKKLSQIYQPFRFHTLSRGKRLTSILAIKQSLQSFINRSGQFEFIQVSGQLQVD